MAELGVIASVIQIADTGLRLSIKLFTFGEIVASADKSVISLSKDVSLTSSVLKELGQILENHGKGDSRFLTHTAIKTADDVVKECLEVFNEMESIIVKKMPNLRAPGVEKSSKATVLLERLKWPYLQPKLNLLQSNLDRLKSTILLMLNVITYARQVATKNEPETAIADQKSLIEDLAQSNQDYIKKFENFKLGIEGQPSNPTTGERSLDNEANSAIRPDVNLLNINAISRDTTDASKALKDIIRFHASAGDDPRLTNLQHYFDMLSNMLHEVDDLRYHIEVPSRSRVRVAVHDTFDQEMHFLAHPFGDDLSRLVRDRFASLVAASRSKWMVPSGSSLGYDAVGLRDLPKQSGREISVEASQAVNLNDGLETTIGPVDAGRPILSSTKSGFLSSSDAATESSEKIISAHETLRDMTRRQRIIPQPSAQPSESSLKYDKLCAGLLTDPQRKRSPCPECGRYFSNLTAHIQTHVLERSEIGAHGDLELSSSTSASISKPERLQRLQSRSTSSHHDEEASKAMPDVQQDLPLNLPPAKRPKTGRKTTNTESSFDGKDDTTPERIDEGPPLTHEGGKRLSHTTTPQSTYPPFPSAEDGLMNFDAAEFMDEDGLLSFDAVDLMAGDIKTVSESDKMIGKESEAPREGEKMHEKDELIENGVAFRLPRGQIRASFWEASEYHAVRRLSSRESMTRLNSDQYELNTLEVLSSHTLDDHSTSLPDPSDKVNSLNQHLGEKVEEMGEPKSASSHEEEEMEEPEGASSHEEEEMEGPEGAPSDEEGVALIDYSQAETQSVELGEVEGFPSPEENEEEQEQNDVEASGRKQEMPETEIDSTMSAADKYMALWILQNP